MRGPSRALSPTRAPRRRSHSSCWHFGTAPTLALCVCCVFLVLMFTRIGVHQSDRNAAFTPKRGGHNARKLAELSAEIGGREKLSQGFDTEIKLGGVEMLNEGGGLQEVSERKGRAARVRVSKPGSKPGGLIEEGTVAEELVDVNEVHGESGSELTGVKKFKQRFGGQLAGVKKFEEQSKGQLAGVKTLQERSEKATLEWDEEAWSDQKGAHEKPLPDEAGSVKVSKDEGQGTDVLGQANTQLQGPVLREPKSGVMEEFGESDPSPGALTNTELVYNEGRAGTDSGQANQILLGDQREDANQGLAASRANQLGQEYIAARPLDELEVGDRLSLRESGQEGLVMNGVIVGLVSEGEEETDVSLLVSSTAIPLTVQAASLVVSSKPFQLEPEEQKQLEFDAQAGLERVTVTGPGVKEHGFKRAQSADEFEDAGIAGMVLTGASDDHVAKKEGSLAFEDSENPFDDVSNDQVAKEEGYLALENFSNPFDDDLSLAILPELSDSASLTENGKGLENTTSLLREAYSSPDADESMSRTVDTLGQPGNGRFQRELTKAFEEGAECMVPGLQLFDGNASLMAGASAYNRCAFVGNSGVMRAAKHGDEIDGHDVVLRSNQAPTRGYEEFVGSKTTFRFLNKKWAVVYASANQGRGFLLPREDPGTVLIASRSEGPEFSRLVTVVQDTRPDVTAVHLSGEVRRCAHVALQSARKAAVANGVLYEGGDVPSTGFLAIFFLLQACESVDVYGLSMERSTGDVAQSWPYHYFEHYIDSENLRAHPHHSFEMEGDLIRALAGERPARIRVADYSAHIRKAGQH